MSPAPKVSPVPDVGPAGARSASEIARLHRHRIEKAQAWFFEAAHGSTPRLCPICGYEGMFSPVRQKPEIWCPGCDSRPRHRLLKLWFDREALLGPGAEVIHFAAEPWVRDWCEAKGARYRTADINDLFELQLDLEALDLPENSLDMLIANHVLEHVDDAKALAEVFRVLKPGGQAILTVPMIEGWDETYEETGLDEAARKLRYGDPDHRRFYGSDIRARIRLAGFDLAEFAATEPDVSAHALHRGERIFIATKPGERPTDETTIRTARPEDAPACAAILNDWIDRTAWMPRCHPPEDVLRHYRDDVLPARRVFIAEQAGETLGFLALDPDGVITALYLAKPARGIGVGKALLDCAKAERPTGLTLWTFVANRGARLFYAREGFAEVRRTDGDNEEGLPDILFAWPGTDTGRGD